MKGSETISRTDWRAMHGLLYFGLTAATAFVHAIRIWPLPWCRSRPASHFPPPVISTLNEHYR